MLHRMDGFVVAVRDAAAAAATYEAALGGVSKDGGSSPALGSRITTVRAGTGEVWLAEPDGPGPAADHLDRWGEGLLACILAARDLDRVVSRLTDLGVDFHLDVDRIHIPPEWTSGLRTVIGPLRDRAPVGPLSCFYEVTSLVHDWRKAAGWWAETFELNPATFSPIRSERFGYEGTLTLFDPSRLDRVEVITPDDPAKAMGRFFGRRGESAYMCYAETDDVPGLRRRLDEAGARYEPRDDSPSPEGLFVHPTALHGVLLGVSRTNLAWRWSGRPELADPAGV